MENNELYHHGVPGMKWGHRKSTPQTSLDVARANYKSDKKQYNKSFHKNEKAKAKETTKNDKVKKAKTKETTKNDKVKKAVAIGSAAAVSILAAYGTYKVSEFVKDRNNAKAIKAKERMDYIMKNISNIPSHTDSTRSIRNSDKYQHALQSTILSRQSSIRGDRSLYGNKAVKGRDAVKEAKSFVDNNYFYNIHRGGMNSGSLYKKKK